ncbi:PBECR4 domain-containing protein [Alkalihalobacillus sp. NPDC078783]
MDDKRELIKKFFEGLEIYERTLMGKEIHYVFCKDNAYHEVVLEAKAENYLHLTGVEYFEGGSRKIKGKEFYKKLKKGKINKAAFQIPFYSEQKINVLNNLKSLTSCTGLRVIDEQIVLEKVTLSAGIRTNRMIFCLGLINTRGDNIFNPCTLLNLKTDVKGKNFAGGVDVQCIYIVDNQEVKKICRSVDFAIYEKNNTYTYNP